jgi:hypothetical protein
MGKNGFIDSWQEDTCKNQRANRTCRWTFPLGQLRGTRWRTGQSALQAPSQEGTILAFSSQEEYTIKISQLSTLEVYKFFSLGNLQDS